MDAYFVNRKAVQVENLFLDFLKKYRADSDPVKDPLTMKANESNTVFVDFSHIMLFSEYLRFEASLRNSCKRIVMEQNPSSRTKLCCRLIRSRCPSD